MSNCHNMVAINELLYLKNAGIQISMFFTSHKQPWQLKKIKILGAVLELPARPVVPVILADHLTLFQPGETDYAHLITAGTPGFSDLPTALNLD